MSFWKKLFGVKESPDADVAKSKSADRSTTFARMDSEANLERWKSSEEPEAWMRVHMKGWNHQDWLELLASLRGSKFWPMDEAAVGQHIEMLRAKLVSGCRRSNSTGSMRTEFLVGTTSRIIGVD